jgi:hypothetical protein
LGSAGSKRNGNAGFTGIFGEEKLTAKWTKNTKLNKNQLLKFSDDSKLVDHFLCGKFIAGPFYQFEIVEFLYAKKINALLVRFPSIVFRFCSIDADRKYPDGIFSGKCIEAKSIGSEV